MGSFEVPRAGLLPGFRADDYGVAVRWFPVRLRWLLGSLPSLAVLTAVGLALAILAHRSDVAVFGLVSLVLSGVALTAGPWLGRVACRFPRTREWLSKVWVPVSLGIAGVFLVRPVLTGEMPTTFLGQDNLIHLARLELFDESLRKWHWPSWTPWVQAGDSLTDLYGWFGNLIVLAVRILSFGTLSLARSYQIVVALLPALTALSLYSLARRFSRRWVAGLAALLIFVGGHVLEHPASTPFWKWHLHVGVWHGLLACVLAIFALAKLVDVSRSRKFGDLLAASLLATFACLTHASGVVAVGLPGGCVLLSVMLGPRPTRAIYPTLALIVGIGLSCFWLLPAAATLASHGLRFPTRTFDDGNAIGQLLGGLSPLMLLAGGFCLLLCLRHRDRAMVGLAGAALVLFLIQSNAQLAELMAFDGGAGKTMQWHRLIVPGVLLVPIAMAGVIESFLRGQSNRVATKQAPIDFTFTLAPLFRLALAIFVALFLVVPSVALTLQTGRRALLTTQVVQIGDPGSVDEAIRLLVQERALPTSTLTRVALLSDSPNASGLFSKLIVQHIPTSVLWYAPGFFLKHRLRYVYDDSLDAFGVSHVIVDAGQQPLNMTLVGHAGLFDVLRYNKPASLARVLSGSARITKPSLLSGGYTFQVEGSGPDGADVQIAFGPYPRLEVFQDGKPIAWSPAASLGGIDREVRDQIQVHVHDGLVSLRPTGKLPRSTAGWFATSLSAALLFAIYRARHLRLSEIQYNPFAGASASKMARWLATRRLELGLALVVVGLVTALVTMAWPRGARQKLWIGLPITYPMRLSRVGAPGAGREIALCGYQWLVRRWQCPGNSPSNAAPDALVSLNAGVDSAPPPYKWPHGAPFSALRIEELTGPSELTLVFPKIRLGQVLHVHAGPTHGDVPAVLFRAGQGEHAIELNLPITGYSHFRLTSAVLGEQQVTLVVRFFSPGAIDLAITSDDDLQDVGAERQ